jgi:hypothetical protein
MEYNKKQLE